MFKEKVNKRTQNKPRMGGHVFRRIKFSSSNLKEVHPRNIHTKLYWNPLSHFGEEDFLKFYYNICHTVKISPAHSCHVFYWIKISSRNPKEVHPRSIHDKLYWNPLSHFTGEDFFKFTICQIVETSPPRAAMFLVGSKFLQGISNRSTQGTLMPNYNEIHRVILKKQIFKVLLYVI